jgi:hypothetical protein
VIPCEALSPSSTTSFLSPMNLTIKKSPISQHHRLRFYFNTKQCVFLLFSFSIIRLFTISW